MKSVELDFGSLELESNTSDVQLRLSSHAEIATSAEDDVAALLERLTSSASNNNSKRRPWITCDNVFQLELSLSLENAVAAAARGDFIDTLMETLKSAKLWRQLDMRAISVEATPSGNHCQLIKIDLSIQQGDTKSAPRRLHKLTVPPALDTRPPPGVCIATLRQVRLDLHLRRDKAANRWKSKRPRIVPSSQAVSTEIPTILTPRSDMNTGRATTAFGNSQRHPESREKRLPIGAEPDLIYEYEDDHLADFDNTLLLAMDTTNDNVQVPDALAQIPSLRKRSSSESSLDIDEPDSCNKHVMDMLDAAIRMMISGSRRDLPKTVSLTSMESLKSLDALIPSIWRSKYSHAVASRAVFLPTIGHALDSVYHRNIDRIKVRNGFDGSSSEHSQDVVEMQHKSKSKLPHAAVSVNLWHKLQATAYDRTTAKKLKPLAPKITKLASNEDFSTEIFDSMEVDFNDIAFNHSEGEDLEDLFEEDFDEVFSEDESQTDLFDIGEIETSATQSSCLEDLVTAFRMDAAETACGRELLMTNDAEQLNDDMLSICDSLGSLPLSEHYFDDFEDLRPIAQNLFDHDEIRI